MYLIITTAVNADDFTAQLFHFLGGAFIGFTIPEMLGTDNGDADGFPLKRQGFCGGGADGDERHQTQGGGQ